MQTSEGRVMVNDAGQYKYEYYLRDHLGSVRARFTEGTNHQASLSGEVHYYPFGMTIAGLTVAGESSTDQLFSGKRLLNQDLSGTRPNWYDFGARNYDAQLGMWFNVDPMAEKYVSFSPYNYCFNNPISFVDPNGMDPVNGAYVFTGEEAREMFRWLIAKEGRSFNSIWNKAAKLKSANGGGGGITYYANANLSIGSSGVILELSNGESKVGIPNWLGNGLTSLFGWHSKIFGNWLYHSNQTGFHIKVNENTTIIHITENSTAPTNDPWGEEAQSDGTNNNIWSKPGIEFGGGLGYKLGLKGKFGLGPLKLGAGFNVFDAEVGAGMSKGMYSKLDVLKGEITLGKASGSYSVFSSSYNFSTNEYDHTFFAPPSWDVNGGSVDNWDFGFSFQSGFVRADMNINPVRTGAQGVLMMDAYSKYKTGKAPPTPIFTIFNLIFGD